jgi:hypothetical protein
MLLVLRVLLHHQVETFQGLFLEVAADFFWRALVGKVLQS